METYSIYYNYYYLSALKYSPKTYPSILTIISATLFCIVSMAKSNGSTSSKSSQPIEKIQNKTHPALLYFATENQKIKCMNE
tara:strand:+ start:101 stop:346 length:246 start_codon:yes stop_codon:yes gene_type:complete